MGGEAIMELGGNKRVYLRAHRGSWLRITAVGSVYEGILREGQWSEGGGGGAPSGSAPIT